MKIIGGMYKNRRVYRPADIRPTQHIVRKALFDILGHDMGGLSFLELFAGSGAVGLEALSRGAQRVLMVEKSPFCARVIEENIGLLRGNLGAEEVTCEVRQADALATVKVFFREGRRFEVIFADPPYGRGMAKKTLKTIDLHNILSPDGLLVIQHEKSETLSETPALRLIQRKRYGTGFLSLYAVNHGGSQIGDLH